MARKTSKSNKTNLSFEKDMLPKEYFDTYFLRGYNQAVDVALHKLWPDFYQYLHEYAAWVEPTVPLLTGEGEIFMSPAIRAASDGRLQEFEVELKALDEQMQEARNWRLDIGSDDEYSDKEDIVSSNSLCSGEASHSSPPTSKSNSPEPEKASEKQLENDDEFATAEYEDGMPAFAKKLRASISTQGDENELLAGCVVEEIN
ncbi:hypothetical protein PTT_16719 [Pyrenophora teres f. teres 0-1]|uniref:Uncharacterized protein n=1 Tax=Pyrenophora teres f. teres (strain 0-1) TaxID=861557 RepID=E3S2W8_PYRTT|nr:hypothetical protein PTT_16719 [Pyrenophora teres f. teres 0-1]